MAIIYNIDPDLYDEIYFNKLREDSRLARYATNHFGFVVVSNKNAAINADIFADKGVVYISRLNSLAISNTCTISSCE